MLDGGYRAWAEGRPAAVTTAEPAPAPGDFTAEPGQMPVLDAAGAQAAARTGLLLDARAGERYRGETEPVDPVAGHIPGAVSAPTAGNVNPDGTFKDPAELAARFAAMDVIPGAGVHPPDVPEDVVMVPPRRGDREEADQEGRVVAAVVPDRLPELASPYRPRAPADRSRAA